MIIRNILLVIFIVSLCFCLSVFALRAEDSESPYKVFLYFDKMVFEDNEKVVLHINIKNNSENRQSFKIYDTEYTTFRPVVYDLTGRELNTLISYRLKNQNASDAVKGITPRIIELLKNETFSYEIDLKTVYRMSAGEEYRVFAFFYPDAKNTESVKGDKQINIKIIRAKGGAAGEGMSHIKKYVSPDRSLTPSDAVMLFLNAEQNNDWDNYFKYIDIEKLINSYPDYVRAYNEAVKNNDLEEKENIILAFVDYLKKKRVDYIISYDIVNERTNNDGVSVDAIVKRYGQNRPSVYRYTYTLERNKNFWLIMNVDAVVIKEEMK